MATGPSAEARVVGRKKRGGDGGVQRDQHIELRVRPRVHVASNHEEGVRRSDGHVKKSQGLDAGPTNRNLMR